MRTAIAVLSVLVAAGCSRPPGADTFVAAPLPSAFVALRSPNGQKQLLIERFGGGWQGVVDDTFAGSSTIVVADSDDGDFPALVKPAAATAPPIDTTGWRRITGRPGIIVDAWSATDPALNSDGPSAIVSLVRLAGDSPQVAAINAFLAAELEGAIGLAPPPGDTLADPGEVASRVATEAALRAVVDEDAGTVSRHARMAVLQIPVLLTNRFIVVEHFVFEDRGDSDGGSSVSRFTLQDIESGHALDMDTIVDANTLERLNAIVSGTAGSAGESPVAWHPARPGIVLVFRANAHGEARRAVVPWREVLPMLPEDSPLRAVADSVD